MAGPKFQIRSRGWNIASVVGVVLLAVLGFGGLFLIRDSFDPDGTTMLWFLVILGIITTLLFAGPGIAYMARKRVAFLKRKLPGSSMGWIRSHLYLPILAVAAAFVHATVAPFRDGLSSGKVTLVVGVLVCIAGVSRHHMIGVQKEVLNLNLAITKRTQGQPRAFRNLVTDLTENRRLLSELDADAAKMGQSQQALWQEIRGLFQRIEEHFPRGGGQRPHVRHYKLWKAVHAPLTAVLFVLVGYHVWDVLGGNQAFFGDEKTAFASSSECAACHTEIFQEWSTSSMAHAQTSTITEGQLPVTLSENRRLAGQLGPQQQELFEQAAKVCINCHAPVGARFAENVDALLPFDEGESAGAGGAGVAVSGGGAAVQEDGIGCITCHTQAAPPPERAGFGELAIDTGSASDYGVQFGPLFDDPKPVPVRVHGMENGEDGVWNDPLTSSRMCGSCHNVKADIDGDGLSPGNLPEDAFTDDKDSDGDFQLDQNELDRGDDKGLDDLTVQTTFDEWQDYVASFDQAFGGDERQTLDGPLGCVECHMPSEGDGTEGVIDHAAGVLPVPERRHQSHSFVGVDYDLDPKQYQKEGMPENALETVLAERQALLQSAVTLEVANQPVQGGVLSADVTVRNNLLGHAFPTGFAFARQFWLEVSARTEAGRDVCLRPPVPGLGTPCRSGVVAEADEDLRQCDPRDVARVTEGQAGPVADTGILFSVAFPADQCDPWLANFQKVLTDGDPDKDGTFVEVPFQSFLPDIVKLRTRVADQQTMAPLESVRTDPDDDGVKEDLTSKTLRYTFNASGLAPDEDVVVTAKLRFRHLPPYFVRDLEERQADLERLPAGARIDAEELLDNMVVTDVVEARSGAGPVLACKGPQNEVGASILDCVEAGGDESASPASGGVASGLASGSPPPAVWRRSLPWALGLLAALGPVAVSRGAPGGSGGRG